MSSKVTSKVHLFSPLKIGDLHLHNRIALAPLTRARAGPSRVPNEHMLKYYKQRSSAGLLISEATSISLQGNGWAQSPGIYTDEMIEGWRKIVDSVHESDAKFFLQLWHTGRQSHSSFQINNQQIVAPSAIAITDDGVQGIDDKKYPREVPRALETDEIPGIVEDYRKASEFAKEAGFDGVEIHAANGYLIDQFLQTCSNVRTDKYGGSLENRYRFLSEIIAAISTVYPSFQTSVRLSPNGNYGSMGSADNIETFSHVLTQLAPLNLAYVHLVDQLAFGFHKKCEQFTLARARQLYPGRLIGNSGYTKESAEKALESGNADMIAFGRLFISNPDLPERFKHGYPLAPPARMPTWYSHDPVVGYTDFPTYSPPAAEAKL